jgi:hypothetical protein
MFWRPLLVAALLAPPVAYVGNVVWASEEPVEQRPPLVLQREAEVPAEAEPRVTLTPRPAPRSDDTDDTDDTDDRNEDRGDDVRVVRPAPQDADDDDGDDRGGIDDDGDDDDTDDAGDD